MVSGVDNFYKCGDRSLILHSLECCRRLPRRDDFTPAMCRVHHDDGAVLLVLPNIMRNTLPCGSSFCKVSQVTHSVGFKMAAVNKPVHVYCRRYMRCWSDLIALMVQRWCYGRPGKAKISYKVKNETTLTDTFPGCRM
jgi:hypothetical protein